VSSGNRIFVCSVSDLAPGEIKLVEREDGNLAVYNVDGTFYCTEDRCSHGLASLSEGSIVGDEIECPMHFGMFRIATGEPTAPPCSVPIKVFPVEVEDDQVFVLSD
jgi:nitrite reductase/ring-hydroxylating ferredoxin subunit